MNTLKNDPNIKEIVFNDTAATYITDEVNKTVIVPVAPKTLETIISETIAKQSTAI